MKKLVKLKVILLFAVIAVACTNEKTVENPDEIKIGVVETTSDQYKSSIHWYNENLEVIDVQKLKYASLGSTFTKPVYDGEDIYLIPEGLFTKKDTQKVISLDKNDFTITEYAVPNIALQDVAVTKDYLFTNSNLNYETHLSRLDRETEEFNEKIFEAAYFESMLSIDNALFLFGNMERDTEKSYLYVLDTDFNLLETIDLTDVGFGAFKFLLDDKDLYVSMSTKMDDTPNSMLLKVNVETYETEVIDLEIDHPDSLVGYKDQLIVAHVDIVTGKGSKITVLDMNTGDKESVDLATNIFYMDIDQNHLIVVDDEKVSLFDLDNDFQLIKKVKIDKKEDTYLSSILVID